MVASWISFELAGWRLLRRLLSYCKTLTVRGSENTFWIHRLQLRLPAGEPRRLWTINRFIRSNSDKNSSLFQRRLPFEVDDSPSPFVCQLVKIWKMFKVFEIHTNLPVSSTNSVLTKSTLSIGEFWESISSFVTSSCSPIFNCLLQWRVVIVFKRILHLKKTAITGSLLVIIFKPTHRFFIDEDRCPIILKTPRTSRESIPLLTQRALLEENSSRSAFIRAFNLAD